MTSRRQPRRRRRLAAGLFCRRPVIELTWPKLAHVGGRVTLRLRSAGCRQLARKTMGRLRRRRRRRRRRGGIKRGGS